MNSVQKIVALMMPKWGMSMDTGKVTKWLVDEGSHLVKGDEVFEIESDKIANSYESPADGILRRQIVGTDEEIPVGGMLGVIAANDVSESEIDTFIADYDVAHVQSEHKESSAEPKTIEINGHRIAYLEMGSGEETILFVHGFGGDHRSWTNVQPLLATSRRTISLDLPGHGASTKDTGAGTLEELAQTLLDFIYATGYRKVHLIGHSLGAAVSALAALLNPERIASLSMIAGAGLGRDIDTGFINDFVCADNRKLLRRVLQHVFSNPDMVNRDMIDDVLKYRRIEGVTEALRKIADASVGDGVQKIFVKDRLEALSLPVLVLWGRDDTIIPVTQIEDLSDAFETHIIEDVGHMVHLEAADAVAQLISHFIGRASLP